MRHLLSAGVIAILGCVWQGVATAAPVAQCTVALSMKADDAVDRVKTWPTLYAFYKTYRICDDGGVAEGVSDAVDQLLTKKWSTLAEAQATLRSDKGFADFVVMHIDETWNWDDSKPVRDNALHRCPQGLSGFCKAVVKQIDTVNSEAKAS